MGAGSGFVPPNEERRTKALGTFSNDNKANEKAVQNVEKYWEPLREPKQGDWLHTYNHGCCGYDNFQGKTVTKTKNKLYIQPIVYREGSKITDENMQNLKLWLEAFYQPCKVVILPKLFEDVLAKNKQIDTQLNVKDKTQYNAIHILKQVIGPIQNKLTDAIGVLSFTDVDLYTKNLSNYCFGYAIPAFGGVQSLHRFMPEYTGEEYESDADFQSKTLQRLCKIGTHELGHNFGLGHCIFYECLMMGTNHIQQTDRNPIFFCPICYRKLQKCLNFDHVKRYQQLSKVCEKFGSTFLEPQEYEMNKLSIKQWVDVRYEDLSKSIKPEDYKKSGTKSTISPIFTPVSKGNGSIPPAGRTAPKVNNNTSANRASTSAPKKEFLKRGAGNKKPNIKG